MKQQDKKRTRFFLLYGFLSIITFLALFAISSFMMDTKKLLENLQEFDLSLLLVLLFFSLFNYILRAYRWNILSKRLGLNLSLSENSIYYIAGFSCTTTPGKVGEIFRLWLINRRYNTRYDQTAPLFVMDKFADLHAMIILALFSAFFMISPFSFLLAIFLMITIFGTIIVMKPNSLRKINYFLFRNIYQKPKSYLKINKLLKLNAKLMRSRAYFISLFISIVGWLFECFAFYFITSKLSMDITLIQAIFIFSLGTTAGILTFLPGGIGGVEASMFSLLVAFGCTSSKALASTLLIRLTTLWFAVILGVLFLPIAYYVSGKPTGNSLKVKIQR